MPIASPSAGMADSFKPQIPHTSMKAIYSLLLAAALSTSAFAGTSYSGKSSKMVQPTTPEPACFAPGWDVGVFGSALISHNGNDVFAGGGVTAEYFFTEMLGIQTNYSVYNTQSEHHQFDGDLVLRFPIHSACIAPYLMAGGGFSTNSDQQGDFNAGAGIEARFGAMKKTGVFLDGAYHFHTGNNDRDFTIARLGVKFVF
ncbi:MAG: hypothetical protein JWO89_3145 [Verrucomicrobiaceae bacterium]|nr:hypothetical protein [Verrucomicrobiaceae bacterium]